MFSGAFAVPGEKGKLKKMSFGHLRVTLPPPLRHSENIFDIFSNLSCLGARQMSPACDIRGKPV